MAHELTIHGEGTAQQRVEMAYTGEVPWHQLGQQLAADASIDEWKRAAGMEWRVQRSKIRFLDGEGTVHTDESEHVLFRSDTKAKLGIVSAGYKIVQPGEMLETFRDLSENAGLRIETAGTLFGGKRFWALAKVNDGVDVQGQDRVSPYVLLSSSCDGSSKTTARFTAIRAVCNNTVTLAFQTSKAAFSCSHRSRFSPEAAKAVLASANAQFASYVEASRALTKLRMDKARVDAFLVQLLGDGKKEAKDVRETKGYKGILRLFQGSALGGTLLSAEGTAWGLVNAVTEYVDHDKSRSSPDHTVWNSWYGPGDALKSAAMDSALALV